ncbi:Fe-S cluster assembly protein SufD [Afifella marina]|uniref:Fe-S cluster assembly protein SufD n=1 Tax=Afifella marina DSM 2698 TaxID=1120955 RepID=A0A1G5NM58_AFIMA|nr:Fe-S cluster assembly protein SufD [Afifella marina]MBK1623717.1 Fe-S cluster assembly protein SufD [Afifella marina DSM 2698]MBK1626710.1 Fe-S cluster assembly protein SufD [Afifella marina]MBK5916259.1 Fe-S cluster assembly protein SufD [Afifella marina]RAI21551.1 Fe-S cluster assembly protein SufD [Afifella marina DSM 2698]SCZ37839.1 Fe-S cluster assembly protein SufD [Afifella marina DSM 2698]
MAEPERTRTKAEEALAQHFAELSGDDPIRDMRTTAFDAFIEKGLPNRRVEDWKYTDLRRLMTDAPAPAEPVNPERARDLVDQADIFADIDRARIVFVNGYFVPPLSDLSGVEDALDFASLGRFLNGGGALLERSEQVDPGEAPVYALNSAFVRDGAVIRIREGAKLTKPLEICTVFAGNGPGLQTLRHQVTVGDGAEAVILQSYVGPDGVGYHTNVVSDIRIGKGAKVKWVKAQEEGDQALHLGLLLPRVEADAVFDPFFFAAGSAVARSEIRMIFDGEGATSGIRGATIARGRQHLDTTLIVDHAVPECVSQEFFKAAIDDEARGVFQGRINVWPHAQKTEGKMMSQALLLSENAEFSNKPELEIFADDVVCGHGATCGQIDEEMLFFMRSRGVPADEAERLLVHAFLAEAIEEIAHDDVVAALEARTRRWLSLGGEVR